MRTTDVMVIGGGVAGATTAFSLAQAGVRVTVIDADLQGSATAAGAGIVQPWGTATTGPLYGLQAAGAAHYATLLESLAELGAEQIGYDRCGGLVVDADSGALDVVERRVLDRVVTSAAAGQVSRLDPGQVRELFPPLAPDLAGLHMSGGARVDGRSLCRSLLTAVTRLGGSVVEGAAALACGDDGVLVMVDGQAWSAGAVVVAAGAWTDRLLAPFDIRVAVDPQRGQISHFRLDDVDTSRWPSISPIADHYMVAFGDSRIVAGATREVGSGFDPRVTAGGQQHVLTNALALAPGLAHATLIETRVGLRPLSADGLPVLGRVNGFDHLYVATGFGPVGLTIGPVCGHLMAQLITSGRTPDQLAPFTPRRP
jgi:D-amino-acid dehydrogenase